MGTESIAPDMTMVNTAGTVRVCNLANLEALMNIIANSTEVICIVAGSFLLMKALTRTQESGRQRWRRAVTAMAVITIGLSTPFAINWCVAFARDNNLFS